MENKQAQLGQRDGGKKLTATLRRTTVSTVSPGPNPNSTPQSSPSPVVLSPSSIDFLLISSNINNTQALDMFPYSPRTCLVALIFSGFNSNLASTWSRIAGPPGCAIQKMEFCTISKEGLTHKTIQMGVAWATKCDSSDLRAYNKNTSSFVVFSQVLSQTHVNATCGAEDEVSNLRLGLAPLLYGLGCCLFPKLWYLHHHHVLPSIQRRSHFGGVAVPMAITVAGPSAL
ncbi:hypothetical protein G2W53_005820 [Senna tora]|uniref:Uncharacterized protein n=1 Tax=Senna tora TaxID=362788 RepID=A0A834X2M2_9FABA|nr:hypothetical protein G2W53_005820 [Senna tora]